MKDISTPEGVRSFSVATTNGPSRLSSERPAPKALRKIRVASVCCVVYTGDRICRAAASSNVYLEEDDDAPLLLFALKTPAPFKEPLIKTP